jgi:hypothetical protein
LVLSSTRGKRSPREVFAVIMRTQAPTGTCGKAASITSDHA